MLLHYLVDLRKEILDTFHPRLQRIETNSEAFESAEMAWKAVQANIDKITAL